jgi:hypothetical protein
MATLEGLSLSISADVKDLLKGLDTGKKNITDFANTGEASLATLGDAYKALQQKQQAATNPADIKRYTAALKEIDGAKKGLVSLATQDLPKLNTGVKQSGQVLTDFGRIAQDAAFGPNAIANNITPLFESFGRLRAETGSAGGALKALGTSLLSPAGLITGVSLLSGALSFASVGLVFWKKLLGDSGEEAKKSKEKTDDYKKAIEGIFAATAKEVVNVQSIVAVLNSEVATRERKLDALNALKKIQPDIFNGVKLEGDAVIGLNAAYAAYLQQIRTVIAVKIKQQQLEKVTEEILKKEGVTLSQQEKDYKEAGQIISKSLEDRANVADRANRFVIAKAKEEQTAQKALQKDYKTQAELLKEIASLQEGIKIPDSAESIDKNTKSTKGFRDIIAEFRKEVAGLQAQLAQGLITKSAVDDGIVKALTSTIGKLGEIKAPIKVQADLVLEFNETIANKFRQDNFEAIRKTVQKDDKPIPVGIKVKPAFTVDVSQAVFDKAAVNDINIKINDLIKSVGGNLSSFSEPLKAKFGKDFSLSELLRQADANPSLYLEQLKGAYAVIGTTIDAQNAAFKDIIVNGFVEGFSGIGDAIAEGIQGGNFAGALFGNLFETLGTALQAYGKKIIATSTLLQKLQTALNVGNFGGSVLIGIGLVALGGLTKGLAGGLKLAGGGFVSGPGSKTSDSIPAQLSRGEFVVRAAAVDKFGVGFLNSINSLQAPTMATGGAVGVGSSPIVSNNMAVDINGQFVITGDSLRLLLERANKTFRTNT